MDEARLTAIREWNESLKHDTDQPYRKLVRAHLVIEDMLNEIERLHKVVAFQEDSIVQHKTMLDNLTVEVERLRAAL